MPSYQITYSKNSKFFKLKLLSILPQVLKAVKEENKTVAKIIQKEQISGIISDNRFGVRSSLVPSVYMTHQINVLSGITTLLTSNIHQKIINKFDECWIPDDELQTFSGKLSNTENLKIPFKFLGILSRFEYKKIKKIYNLTVVLSGVEPQRSIFEKQLLNQLENYSGNVLFIRGIIDSKKTIASKKNITIKNYLRSSELELVLNQSKLVLMRSGYSSIMDLAKLGKKVFFIPTPGQNEQEYLASFLQEKKRAPFSKQKYFKIENLSGIVNYTGFENCKSEVDLNIFSLF